MSDNRDTKFCLEKPELDSFDFISGLIRSRVSLMSPKLMRSTSVLLLAIARLPLVTQGIEISLLFKTSRFYGNYGWVDIDFFDTEIRLGRGEYFYSEDIGGDWHTTTDFEIIAGWEHADGSIDDWLELAPYLITNCEPVLDHDESDYEIINDYFNEEDS